MYSFCLTSAVEYQESDNQGRLEGYILSMAGGDKNAIAELYRQTSAAVYGFALSILKNMHDAEDVLQETYIRIYAASGRYEANGNPMPWIFTIARNLALMKLRERKKTTELPEEDLVFCGEDTSLTAADRIVLSAAMEVLSGEERQILMLHAVAGFKHREIATLLQLPLSTVLSKYYRATSKVRKKLEGRK